MTKLSRRSRLFATVLLVVVVGTGYLVVPVSERRISQASCDKIQVGWSVTQVENLLGEHEDAKSLDWWGTGGAGLVWYDEDRNRILVSVFVPGDSMTKPSVTSKRYLAGDLSFAERVKRRVMKRLRALWP